MIKVLIRSIRLEAEGIRSFELSPVSGTLPDWTPGAHIRVELAPGLQRAYSLCNHPHETGCYRIAVKLETPSRGGSAAMHKLVPGQTLSISPPDNLFALDATAQHHILLAGGIGITPLYAMYNALRRAGKPVALHAFARSADHALFTEHFTEHLTAQATQHHGKDAAATHATLAQIIAAHAADADTTFYTCGPAPFMDAVSQAIAAAGIPPERLRSERFAPPPVAAGQATSAEGFRVRFARSGIEADVPADKTIIELARECGVDIPTSCEMGVCGACLSNLIEGEADHRDEYLSAAEQAEGRCILPCVSRSHSPVLVIDR